MCLYTQKHFVCHLLLISCQLNFSWVGTVKDSVVGKFLLVCKKVLRCERETEASFNQTSIPYIILEKPIYPYEINGKAVQVPFGLELL